MRRLYVNPWRSPISYAMLFEDAWLSAQGSDEVIWSDLARLDWPYSGSRWRWGASMATRSRPAPPTFRAKFLSELGAVDRSLERLSSGGPGLPHDDLERVRHFLYLTEASALLGHGDISVGDVPAYIRRGVDKSLAALAPRLDALLKDVDEVVVVNGRTRVGALVVEASRMRQIPFRILELANSPDQWRSWPMAWPNDRIVEEQLMLLAWRSADERTRDALAEDFLNQRIANEPLQGWRFQPEHHSKGDLDQLMRQVGRSGGRTIAFFPTTSAELSLRLERSTETWTQSEAVAALAGVAKHHGYSLIVRVHPQPWGQREKQEDALWAEVTKGLDVHLVSSSSAINSYELAHAVDVCATFLSGIGPELVWLGRPTVILGDPYWAELFSSYVAQDLDSLHGLLRAPIAPPERDAALVWAYYMATSGRPYRATKVAGPGRIEDGKGPIDAVGPLGRMMVMLREKCLEPLLGARRV